MAEITKIPKIGKIGKIGTERARRRVAPDEGPVTGGGVRQYDLVPEALRPLARRIGMKRARAVWRLKQRGVLGTAPELLAYQWLSGRRWLTFEFQSSQMGGRLVAGGAVIDFLISGLAADGLYVWRVQGEYWHQGEAAEAKDEGQRVRLLKLRIGGLPVVAVVDLWENDVYDRFPEVFEKAEMGIGLRE